ncbi:MAG TPA: response regulator [Syntrophorhabdaceae bacterium]|jgi:CheY-like chemotaxis protein
MPRPKRSEARKHVLFVDDDEILIEMNIGRLEGMGYKVTATTDSLQALALFRAHPGNFDLVITDHVMPRMTGIKLAGRLKELRPDVPIILLTGIDNETAVDEALRAGISACAPKVLSEKELAHLVEDVLREPVKGARV